MIASLNPWTTMAATRVGIVVWAGVLAAACGDGDGDATTIVAPPADPGGGELGAQGAPTYWHDVAPIFDRRCVGCHQEAGIAPFSLTDYEGAENWAGAAAAAVQARVMPPWLMRDDGSCNDFANSRWLSDEEIDTIVAWSRAGAPQGTPAPRAPAPPTLRLDRGEPFNTPVYTPEAEGSELSRFDDYHCFVVGDPLAQDTFLTGYEVLPGTPGLVHHVLVMPVQPGLVVDREGRTNGDVIAALDAESPDREGWSCFGAAGDGVGIEGFPVTWAPGMGPVSYPQGVGVGLRAGTVFVAQVHYNLSDSALRGQTDQTEIRLRFDESVARPGFFDLPDPFLDSIFDESPESLPAGQAQVPYTWERPLDDYFDALGVDGLDLYGLFPHMHELGRSQSVSRVKSGGQIDCLGEVPRWDFNWQLFYFYQQPVRLERGDTLRVTCNFDTSGRSEPTLPGWGTQNEMCLSGMLLVP